MLSITFSTLNMILFFFLLGDQVVKKVKSLQPQYSQERSKLMSAKSRSADEEQKKGRISWVDFSLCNF